MPTKSMPYLLDKSRFVFHALKNPQVIIILFLGFSAGLPLWLIFSSLSLWLREAGVERSVVTIFSWAALGYSFKFVWAPLVDSLPLPWLTRRLGRRRSWLLLSQLLVIVTIVAMSSFDPLQSPSHLWMLALFAVMLGFSSATQDIVIDALRIEMAPANMQSLLSASYIAGYRIGLIVSGAGVLYLASLFGSKEDAYLYTAWQYAYLVMACVMLIGVITTLVVQEPKRASAVTIGDGRDYRQILFLFLCCVGVFIASYIVTSDWAAVIVQAMREILSNRALSTVIVEALRLLFAMGLSVLAATLLIKLSIVDSRVPHTLYMLPIKEFFQRHNVRTVILLLLLIGLYRMSDIVLGVIANVFYFDMGYSKTDIASVSKLFGVVMSVLGGFLGGFMSLRIGVMKVLLLGAILSSVTNLLFIVVSYGDGQIGLLYWTITADNLSAGIASAAFVAFLSALTNIQFTATQYAIFTSLMTLLPKILGGYSGAMVDQLGYVQFFMLTAALGIPVIILIILIRKLSLREFSLA